MTLVDTLPVALTAPSRAFFAAWDSWRGGALVPPHRAMQTAGLGELLTRCLLLEIRGRDAIPIRFAGSAVGQLLGIELGGRNYLDLTEPENRARRAALLFTEVAQPCAAVIYYWLKAGNGMTLPVELVSAPLVADGETQPGLVLACASPLIRADMAESRVTPDSLAEGEGLRFIDIGAGVPPVGPDLVMAQRVQ